MKMTVRDIVDVTGKALWSGKANLMSWLINRTLMHDNELCKQVRDTGECDVQLIIGGKEFDLSEVIAEWERCLDDMVTERAKDVVQTKCVDFSNLMYDLERQVKEQLDESSEG